MNNSTTARQFLTSKDSPDRLAEKAPLNFSARKDSGLPSVLVLPDKTFQEVEGFGAAFTEAAAVTLEKMSGDNQKRILDAFFNAETGHGYSLCRTHIQSCDFSLGNYGYTETGDSEFSIARDHKHLLPMIKAAQSAASAPFKLFASPWSPPAWMKTNGKMNEGGKLRPECREPWAQTFVDYIRAYEKLGIEIWAVTVQNEPAATQKWDSCIYTAEEERDFVRDYLGPALEKAGHGHVKIIIWDHNRDLLVHRASVAYADPAASKYIWGTGFHWYGENKFDNVRLHNEAWPDKKLIFTEGCQEGGTHLGSWGLGERYARSMINDLNRGTVGWVDWNIILDENGGPNHVNNLCSAPIIADTVHNELLFQSSYYYIGHFARFIKPGAKRVLCATTLDDLEATAFLNPDGKISVVVLNRTESEWNFTLDSGDQSTPCKLPAHSIATYVY